MILVCVEAELNIKNASEDDEKRPLDIQEVCRGLRFLADSNRRIRFCRPPPNPLIIKNINDLLFLTFWQKPVKISTLPQKKEGLWGF